MKDRYENITVSTKNMKLRIIAFIVLFVIAAGAFSLAAVNIGKKEPGYQLVEENTVSDALLYGSNFSFYYYCDGKSDSIKKQLSLVRAAYSTDLAIIYKSLDPRNEYSGMNNLATLNANPGEAVTVSDELYSLLKDAYTRSEESKSWSLFAGALEDFWQSLLVLEDPEAFDPLVNDGMPERLQEICRQVGDTSNFSLEFGTDNTVTLNVSDTYTAFAKKYEIDAPVLDLGMLYDAYALDWLAMNLESQGYGAGYICTAAGCVKLLSANAEAEISLYGTQDGEYLSLAQVSAAPGSFICTLSGRSLTSDYASYSIKSGGETVYRSRYYMTDGEKASQLVQVTAISPAGNCCDAVLGALDIYSASGSSSAAIRAEALEAENIGICLALPGDDRTLYAGSGLASEIKASDTCTVKLIGELK